MKKNIHTLIQSQIREKYNLDNKEYVIKKVAARDLLNISRFDLFAKLYYISNRESNLVLSNLVYTEHIKILCSFKGECNLPDHSNIDNLQAMFNKIIEEISSPHFDESKYVIPVDKNGIILDGSHQIAALAYYDKEVTILQFKDVESKDTFNYRYFLDRGLSQKLADIIALEATKWCKNIYAACLWPKISSRKDRERIKQIIKERNILLYEKPMFLSLENLVRLIANIYAQKEWVGNEENGYEGAQYKAGNCFSIHKQSELIIFQSSLPLEEIVKMKESIRSHFYYGKHSIHITDNDSETQSLAELVLDGNVKKSWFKTENLNLIDELRVKARELRVLLKYGFLQLKINVYDLIHS